MLLPFSPLRTAALTLIPFTLLVAGCGATKPLDNFTESFETHIYADGTKLFNYHYRTRRDLYALSPLDYSEGFTDGQSVFTAQGLRESTERRLRSRVSSIMDETQYCREGFLTLSSYAGYGIASLRGECREGATAEDRKRFPNTREDSAAPR